MPRFLALTVLVVLAGGLLGWVAYWSRRRFRASPARSRAAYLARWILAALALAASAAFPPMRRAAVWTSDSARPMPAPNALSFDRSTFGYIPSYAWVGSVGRQEPYDPGSQVVIDERWKYECRSTQWVVDWLLLAGQCLVLGVLLLPFLRAKRRYAPTASNRAPRFRAGETRMRAPPHR
jgi:hypothetical protein